VAVDFWDTAGQERFASMHASYYYRAHACVLVFDVTRKVTYTNLQAWYRELRQFCPHIPCICIANKIDVDYAVTTKAFAFPGKHGLPFFFVSAADGTNVVAIFQEAVRLAWAYKTRGEKDFVEEVLELIDDVRAAARRLRKCPVSRSPRPLLSRSHHALSLSSRTPHAHGPCRRRWAPLARRCTAPTARQSLARGRRRGRTRPAAAAAAAVAAAAAAAARARSDGEPGGARHIKTPRRFYDYRLNTHAASRASHAGPPLTLGAPPWACWPPGRGSR
jgi:hypothetical protein